MTAIFAFIACCAFGAGLEWFLIGLVCLILDDRQ